MVVAAPIDSLHLTGTLVRIVRFADRGLRAGLTEDLGVNELGVLGTIDKGIDLPSAIARSLRLDPARVTRVTDHLVQQGLIERGADATDRRRCPLSLTSAGKKRLTQGRAVLTQSMLSLLDSVSPEQRNHLVGGLNQLRDVLDRLPLD